MPGDAAASTLTELIDMWAAATPDAAAIVAGTDELTYAELAREVDRSADRLAHHGIGEGARVGLLAERNADTIVALLAILACGAAYVPLDPQYPAERLRFIAADADLRAVVGRRDIAASSGVDPARVIDPATPTGLSIPMRPATSRPGEDSTAYLLYTSGSTGQPKGCVITHRNVISMLRGVLPQLEVNNHDRWTLFHSLCFDFSVWEMWGAFASGAALVVVPPNVLISSEDLVEFVRHHRVTVLGQVPSVFRYTVEAYEDLGRPELSLRWLCFGGESIDLDLIAHFTRAAGPAAPRAVNLYGLTETSVISTVKVVDAATLQATHVRSPIGQPIPDVEVYVLDTSLQPVAEGAPGELWLSGPTLASGYFQREDLTEERFVDLPLSTQGSPVRCYRTGDIVRRLPEGGMDYLGRNDDQVKIRGFRVELREIEAALNSVAAVRDSAVFVVDSPVGSQLAACVVHHRSATELREHELRAQLANVLPAHMVPRTYRTVDQIPLLPSGKRDAARVVELFAREIS